MTKRKLHRFRSKKKKKEKEPKKLGLVDYILAIVNVALLFPFIYILSKFLADVIRFIIKILSEVT